MGNDNIRMLQETLQIMKQGSYVVKENRVKLKLHPEVMKTVRVLLPEEVRSIVNQKDHEGIHCPGRCRHDCRNEDSFTTARNMYKNYGYTRYKDCSYAFQEETKPVLVLNLANPVNPGGGVRRGARAQEEDLCRKSSLLLSLESREASKYYQYNKGLNTYMGSDAMIFTPWVEIIRDENGALLEDSVIVSVVTCAAPMIRYGKEGLGEEEYRKLVYDRIMGMLICAAYFGYDHLVLGAWGCGAFGNDARVVSDLFYKALKELNWNGLQEKDLFDVIHFAVLDRTREQYNFKEFYRNFSFDNFFREENEAEAMRVRQKMRDRERCLDPIRGCLMGGAAGDALGYPVEFLREKEIHLYYGEGGIREYVLDASSGKALISDDTQMALFTANGALIADTQLSMRGIGRTPSICMPMCYQDWLRTQEISYEKSRKNSEGAVCDSISWLSDVPELYARRAPGNTCLSELMRQRAVKDPSENFMKHPQNDSKGCGGIMRVAPLACMKFRSMEALDLEAAEIAAITHGHSLGYMPAAVLVHIISRIIYPAGTKTLKEIVLEARDTATRIFAGDKHLQELTDIIDRAVRLSENGESDIDNIHRLGEGWVAEETLAIAIYCSLRHQNDFSAGIIAAVNHKGDSDSTGAVTGNILGALVGYEAIDSKWKTKLELKEVILEMADDLCHGCLMNEYSHYRDEDWMRKYVDMRWK